jgi:hypothetical protein
MSTTDPDLSYQPIAVRLHADDYDLQLTLQAGVAETSFDELDTTLVTDEEFDQEFDEAAAAMVISVVQQNGGEDVQITIDNDVSSTITVPFDELPQELDELVRQQMTIIEVVRVAQ